MKLQIIIVLIIALAIEGSKVKEKKAGASPKGITGISKSGAKAPGMVTSVYTKCPCKCREYNTTLA